MPSAIDHFPQHPLSAAFPAMSHSDFRELKEDIRANGQRDKITLFEGMVLDGWHRYTACLAMERPALMEDLPEGADPVAFVISRNLKRRHLDASQRAVAVAECHAWRPVGNPNWTSDAGAQGGEGSDRDAQSDTSAQLEGKQGDARFRATNAQMAEVAGVSPTTIKHAKAAIQAGRAEEVKKGEISVRKAAEEAKPKPAATKPQAAPRPAPEPEPKEEPPDLVKELEASLKENQNLHELVDSLQKSDLAKEVATWKGKYDAINGRVHQLCETQAQMERQLVRQKRVLDEAAKLLGVEAHSKIVSAIKERAGA